MADIVYTYKNGIYLNITNYCPCNCTFCIRSMGDGLGSSSNLWLTDEPSAADVISILDHFDTTGYDSIIFCGYGEPTCAFDNLIEISKYIRWKHPQLKIRVNTNGLSDLINKKSTAKLLCENVDAVSISLNAPSAEKYLEITRPSFGIISFDSMLTFASECRKYSSDVTLSVVDTLSHNDIEECRKLAAELNIPLRIRNYGE